MLEANQYPPHFYNPIIKQTIEKIIHPYNTVAEQEEQEQEKDEKLMFVQYRGKVSEKFKESLTRIKAPSKIIFTTCKLKSTLPSLKPVVEMPLKSRVVYKISCPGCEACYVGQTSRHLVTRIKEHTRSAPVGAHFKRCNVPLSMKSVSIVTSSKNIYQLLTMEALAIKSLKPTLNTKDEYRSRTLTIKL